MFKHTFMTILASLGLAACTTGTTAPEAAAPVAPDPATNQAPAGELDMWARVGELPAQTVTKDSCGLFLWANLPKRTLVFFTSNQTNRAQVMFGGKERTLPLIAANGDSMLGHFSIQHYEDSQLKVTVSFDAEAKDGLRDGAIIRNGTWRIEEKGGWELILPVAGLIGCN